MLGSLLDFLARFLAPAVPGIGLLAAFFFLPAHAFGKTVDLGKVFGPASAIAAHLFFDHDDPERAQKRDTLEGLSEEYQALLESLKPGDIVLFSDGKKYRLLEPIGTGSMASVWKVEGPFALRLTLLNEETMGLAFQLGMAVSFARGWKILKEKTGNVIQFYSNPDLFEYTLVSYIQDPKNPKAFTFSEFWEAFQNSKGDLKEFHGYQTSELISALIPIAKDLSEISVIAEGLQMAWSGKAWILFDFSEQISMFDDPSYRKYANHTVWEGYRWHLPDKVEPVTEIRGGKEYRYDRITPQRFTPPILKTLIATSMRERKARTCQRILSQIRKRSIVENGSPQGLSR